MTKIKGYKVFNPDWTCRDFQYEVGKTYKHKGDIKMCGAGFHFCRRASDCFEYYSFDSKNKVAEVEAVGLVESEGNKSVTNEIHIVREISWLELLTIVNEGKGCTGFGNTGNWNTGNSNTGDWNTGNSNTGNRNTGDWNTGFFNTISPNLWLFNKPTNLTRDEIVNIRGISILDWNYENNWWIYSDNMTDYEKASHPEHEYTGGYLKSVPFKKACQIMWGRLTNDEKSEVKKIPNFNRDIFFEITGIDVTEGN